jgi:hypothetical protein
LIGINLLFIIIYEIKYKCILNHFYVFLLVFLGCLVYGALTFLFSECQYSII